jgi:hypothetical protein
LLLDRFVLFEKFIEQHRVHLIIAHTVGFALLIPHHEVRIHPFHFLGHEAELRDPVGVKFLFIAEGNRFEREDRFARIVYWLDLVLKRVEEGATPSWPLPLTTTAVPVTAVPLIPAINVAF